MPPLDDTEPLPPVDPQTAMRDRAQAVYQGMRDRGMDAPTAVGWAANSVVETRAKPYGPRSPTGAAGTFQWLGPRLDAYRALHGHEPEEGDLDEHLDHVVWENHNTEAPAWSAIQRAPADPVAKAVAIRSAWERPGRTPEEIAQEERNVAGAARSLSWLISTAHAAEPAQPATPRIADQIGAARKAGYTDAEIAAYLGQSKTLGPKLEAARRAGYSDPEIWGHYGLKMEPPGGAIDEGTWDNADEAPPAETGTPTWKPKGAFNRWTPDNENVTLEPNPDAYRAVQEAAGVAPPRDLAEGQGQDTPEEMNARLAQVHIPAGTAAPVGNEGQPSVPELNALMSTAPVTPGADLQARTWKWGLPGHEGEPMHVSRPPMTTAQGYASAAGQIVPETGAALAGAGQAALRNQIMVNRALAPAMDAIDQGVSPQDAVKSLSQVERGLLSQYLVATPEQRAQIRTDMAALEQPGADNAAIRTGQAIQRAGEQAFPMPENASFGQKIVAGISGMVPMVAAGVAGGVVAGPPGVIAATLPIIGAQSYNHTLAAASQAGASSDEANRAAGIAALTQMGIMALPVGRVLQLHPQLTPGLTTALLDLAKRGTEFGTFNAMAAFADNYVARQTYEPNRDLMRGVPEAAAIGAVTGGAFGAPGVARALPGAVSRSGRYADAFSDYLANGPGETPEQAAGRAERESRDAWQAEMNRYWPGQQLALPAPAAAMPPPRRPVTPEAVAQREAAQPAAPPPVIAVPPTPQHLLVPAHPAPDGSGAVTNLSDGDYARVMAAKPPLPSPALDALKAIAGGQQPQAVASAASPPVPALPAPAQPSGAVGQAAAQVREPTTEPLAVTSPQPSSPPTGAYVMLDPQQLTVDPERFQYKEAGDRGVTGALHGVSQWEPALANPITAWEGNDGRLYVVNGHQRHDLASRAQAAGQPGVQMPARVYREADGYTPQYMRELGAYQNIAEGSGTPIDAARVLRAAGGQPNDRRLPDLPPRGQMVQQGRALAKLSPEAFGVVENGIVPPAYAAHVGEIISDPTEQMAALDVLNRAQPATSEQARLVVQDVRNSGFLKGSQTTLFGDEDFARSLIPERARVLDNALRTLRRVGGVFRAAVQGEESLTAAGNRMNAAANTQAKGENAQILDILQRNATARGPISDALSASARELADGKPIGSVAPRFLGAVRALVRSGSHEGVRSGVASGREEPARRAVGDQAEAYREELPGEGLFAGRRLPTPPQAGPDLFGDNRTAPAPREAEPTIRDDQRQAVMPGMERSAVQAQAARDAAGPRSNQEPANQGLFARPETPQPELPRVSRWPHTSGENFQDRLGQFREAGHNAAADWVSAIGIETGHEHIAVVDNRTGAIVHAGTNERTNFVGFHRDNGARQTDAYTVHHNHPNNTALSDADVAMLANPGISHVVAHGHDGTTTTASLNPEIAAQRSADQHDIARGALALATAYRRALPVSERILRPLMDAGEITRETANQLYNDLANRLLHAQRVINYTSTLQLAAPVRAAFNAELRKLGHAPGAYDRYAIAVRPEERIAGLPAPVAHQPGEGTPRGEASHDPGQGVSGTLLEGEGLRAGEEPPDRTPDQERAIRRAMRNGPLPPREMPDMVTQGPPRPPREPREAAAPPEGVLPLREPPQPDRAAPGVPPPPPLDSLWGTPPEPPEPPRPPEVEAARITRPQAVKNLNEAEKYMIFPRVLASLDEASARLWNAWQARERDETTNAHALRQVIAPNFLKLSKADRLHVAGALEIARIEGAENLIANPDGTITARNMSTPFARWSKVGDDVHLTPQETAAYHEAVQLGKDQWEMLMRAAAKRYGWGGAIDPAAIRAEAESRGEPGDYHRLNRLADLLDVMRQHEQDIYFPMQRFGSYFIAIRPKEGDAVVAGLGGHPPLAWFETIEKPAFQDILGIAQGRLSVGTAAEKRIADLHADFPPDRFDYQHGDFVRHPNLLRQLNIPAIEKLFMLMENRVKTGIRDEVMRSDNPPTTKTGIREEAKNRYDALHGSTLEAFYDALFEQLKAGYRRRARVVPGYSANFDRAISSHLYQIARNAADTVHRDSIESQYQNLQDFHPHENVKKYWANWRAYQEDPGSPMSRAAATMNQVGFAWMLGMNPSSTIIIGMHTPMTAAPVLSVGVGPKVAVPLLVRGLGRAYGALSFDMKHGGHIDLDRAMSGMAPDKQAFLWKMAEEGRLAAVGTHDMASLSDKMTSLFGGKAALVRRGMEISTSNVHAVDQANRFAVASAAWDIASDPAQFNAAAAPLMQHNAVFRDMVQREGLSPETYGRFMLSQAAFDWGKENKAPLMRGPLGTLMFSLHGFQTRYLSTALNLAKNSGPEGRFSFMLMMAALGLGAGALGLPFAQDAMKGADAVWHYFTGRDPGLKFKLHDAIQDTGMGEVGADLILQGPLSVAAGVNMGGRIGFGDVLEREFQSTNVIGTVPSIMWSAYSGASQRIASGQNAAAVAAEIAPAALRGPLRAYAATQQGILSRAGKTVVPPEELSKTDIARLATGFQPLTIARQQEERERYYAAQHSEAAWRDMIRGGDSETAIYEMVQAGWGPGRRRQFLRETLNPPTQSKQYQRFEKQRHGATP